MRVEVFEYTLEILEKHLDSFSHVNNATYLELYEEARWDFITKKGFGLERIKGDRLAPVILDLHIFYRSELTLREKILIKSEFKSMKNRLVMIMEQTIYNESGKKASTMKFNMGLMNLDTRKLVNPTEDWMKAIGLLEDEAAEAYLS